MKLSVIIPCYNAADTIATQLEALAIQRWSEQWEVIVSDNGSTDETLAIVEKYRDRLPSLQVVDSSSLRGAAHARNVGASTATGDALAFCDADDEVEVGWVAAMGEALAKYDFVASRFDMEKLNAPWVKEIYSNSQQEGVQKYTYPSYLPHAGCSGLGVKRSLHDAIGGFDESWLCLEETDYCWRIQLNGRDLHFVPNAVVHVRHRHSYGAIYQQTRNWAEYNVLIYKKYRSLGMPKLSWKAGVRNWANLVRGVPQIRHKVGRGVWIRHFARCMGRLEGSIKHRVFAL